MRSLVYVAGPITNHPEGPWIGVRDALTVGDALFDKGYAPFVPHLTHYWEVEHNQARTYEDWMALDLTVVPRCDALIRLPGYSEGSDREVKAAEEAGVPVFRDLVDLFRSVPADHREPIALPAVPKESTAGQGGHGFPNGPEWLRSTLSLTNTALAPEVPPAVVGALDHIAAVFQKKNADYADESESWDSNFRDVARQMGWDSPAEACEALIAVKQARLKSMRSNGRLPQNESVADTILDRAVYSVIALALDEENNRG